MKAFDKPICKSSQLRNIKLVRGVMHVSNHAKKKDKSIKTDLNMIIIN